MNQAFTSEERAQFTAPLRPLVEAKEYVRRLAVAYAWAVKHECLFNLFFLKKLVDGQ